MRNIQNYKHKDFTHRSIANMKKYFIISQLNSWDMDSYVDNFNKIIKQVVEEGDSKRSLDFPFEKIRNFVKKSNKRDCDLSSSSFDDENLRWFILKILIPDRVYYYMKDPNERFNPEIDHIFPKLPEGKEKYPDKYFKWVDTVWNLQPVKGDINGLKLNNLPQDFFSDHPNYLEAYAFLPNNKVRTKIWSADHAKEFILCRKNNMLKFVRKEYGIRIS